jgi:hypothetical protein
MRLHTLVATLALGTLLALALPGAAEAHGYVSFGLGFYAPFYPPWPYPYYGYHGNPPRRLYYAEARGVGALELHVKPGKAEVRVDGRLAGEAKEFDGSPSLLWLRKGTHKITVSLAGYQTFEEDYRLAPGEVFEVHLQMKK